MNHAPDRTRDSDAPRHDLWHTHRRWVRQRRQGPDHSDILEATCNDCLLHAGRQLITEATRLKAEGDRTFGARCSPRYERDLTTGLLTDGGFGTRCDLSIVVADDAVIVKLAAHSLVFEGVSKRSPDDDPCAELGITLALSRAFQSAAEYYDSFAEQITEEESRKRKRSRRG